MNFIISLRVSYVSHSSVGEAIETDLLDRKSVDTLLVGGFNHLEKYESQWEGLSHILWTIKVMFQTTNQIKMDLAEVFLPGSFGFEELGEELDPGPHICPHHRTKEAWDLVPCIQLKPWQSPGARDDSVMNHYQLQRESIDAVGEYHCQGNYQMIKAQNSRQFTAYSFYSWTFCTIFEYKLGPQPWCEPCCPEGLDQWELRPCLGRRVGSEISCRLDISGSFWVGSTFPHSKLQWTWMK